MLIFSLLCVLFIYYIAYRLFRKSISFKLIFNVNLNLLNVSRLYLYLSISSPYYMHTYTRARVIKYYSSNKNIVCNYIWNTNGLVIKLYINRAYKLIFTISSSLYSRNIMINYLTLFSLHLATFSHS